MPGHSGETTRANDMKIDKRDLTILRDDVLPLFWTGGQYARERFHGDSVDTWTKPDGTVVSDVDRHLHAMLTQGLQHRFGEPVLSEEGPVPELGPNENFWIIDPLDGTSNFLNGHTRYFLMGARACEGKIQQSIIVHPPTQQVYLAVRGGGVWRGTKGGKLQPWEKSIREKKKDLTAANIKLVDGHSGDGVQMIRNQISRDFGIPVINAGATETSTLTTAQGPHRLHVSAAPIWDLAPVALLLGERGGKCSDLEGQSLNWEAGLDGRFLPWIATLGVEHQLVVEAVGAYTEDAPEDSS